MAQTNFTPISLYYSTTAAAVPTAGNLVAGELAINTQDGKLFYKDAAGVVQTIASKDVNSGTFTNISVSGVASFADGTVSLPSITNIGDTNTGIFFPAADTIAFTEGGVESMRITSAGDVGIGTTSPLGKLEVRGSGNTALYLHTGNNSGDNSLIYFGDTGSATVGLLAYDHGTNAMTFHTNSAERMRIDSSGNLLVGTTSPISSERLNVTSTGTIAGWFQTTNSATSGVVGIYSVIPSTAFNTNCTHFSGQTSGINTWFLYGNGTTSYVSDVNLKKNIVTTRDGYLDDLAKLRVVKYQWKINSDNSPTELGFIAQEVAEVFPALVKDSIPAKEGDPTNKVILGSVLQPILIKSVQELYALVQEQQTLIENLTTRLNALEGK